jgi:predicted ATPase
MNEALHSSHERERERGREQVRLLLTGGPGAGKSTLQDSLCAALEARGEHAAALREYPRRYLRDTGAYEHPFERFIVYLGSLRDEDEADPSARFLVCDDAPFIHVPYARPYRPEGHPLLSKWDEGLASVAALEQGRAHDYLTYLLPSGAFEAQNDAERFNAHQQEELMAHIEGYLKEQGAAYITLTARSVEGRVAEVLADLEARRVLGERTGGEG